MSGIPRGEALLCATRRARGAALPHRGVEHQRQRWAEEGLEGPAPPPTPRCPPHPLLPCSAWAPVGGWGALRGDAGSDERTLRERSQDPGSRPPCGSLADREEPCEERMLAWGPRGRPGGSARVSGERVCTERERRSLSLEQTAGDRQGQSFLVITKNVPAQRGCLE